MPYLRRFSTFFVQGLHLTATPKTYTFQLILFKACTFRQINTSILLLGHAILHASTFAALCLAARNLENLVQTCNLIVLFLQTFPNLTSFVAKTSYPKLYRVLPTNLRFWAGIPTCGIVRRFREIRRLVGEYPILTVTRYVHCTFLTLQDYIVQSCKFTRI